MFALLKSDGPLATREVAGRLNIEKALVTATLKQMKSAGLLTSIGIRAGSKWALPGTKPAKEAP